LAARPLSSSPVSPFWLWVQVLIVIFVLIAAVIALTKLF
jgi:hypothetical protein